MSTERIVLRLTPAELDNVIKTDMNGLIVPSECFGREFSRIWIEGTDLMVEWSWAKPDIEVHAPGEAVVIGPHAAAWVAGEVPS